MKKLLLLTLLSTFLFSNEIKPVWIHDNDKILEGGWTETIYNGVKKFEKKTDIKTKIISEPSASKTKTLIAELVKDGYNPIIFSSSKFSKDTLRNILKKYSKTRFIIFSGISDMPNAYYISFANQESSFLAGYLAAKKSKTKKIGFLGGANLPVIRNFLCGYIKGAKYADKNVLVDYKYLGPDFAAWTKSKEEYDIVTKEIKNGSDVIFVPAGSNSVRALKAAHDNGVYGIGVDANQNHFFPGSVLTSVMVRIDNAVFRALMAAKGNIWGEQIQALGLQEKGVELAFDKYNENLISKKLRDELDQITADIILKNINLPSYSSLNACIYEGKKLF
jgi:basic membrane protein A